MARGIEVIARGVVRRGNCVLACRDVRGGYLYLPGGHVEFGESAESALLRELEEEAGLSGRILGCMLVCEQRFEQGGKAHHELNLVFHVEHLRSGDSGGRPPTSEKPTSDATEAPAVVSREPDIAFEWVDLASIVDRDFRPRAIKAWLASGLGGVREDGCASESERTGTTGVLWLSDSE